MHVFVGHGFINLKLSTNKIYKIASKTSFITIGGMDQGKLFWPNLWLKENWNKFDYGILPGKQWAKMWKRSSWYDKSHPKKKMLLMGWPKTENLFQQKKNKIKDKVILYAPCFETDNKCKDVIDSIKNTKIKILIKHLPWNGKNEMGQNVSGGIYLYTIETPSFSKTKKMILLK